MKISQREGHRLKKRAAELEGILDRQRDKWAQQFIGVEITRVKWEPEASVPMVLRTAKRLKHAVVALVDDDGTVRFVALPLPKSESPR